MRLALFGGSFDPPHIGHVRIALEAFSTLGIEKLIIVPAYRNPFKHTINAPSEMRLSWLKQIFAPYPNIEISDFEIKQQRPVFTIETVRHYKKEGDTFYLIIGADNLSTLDKWNQYEDLVKEVEFVVASRGDTPIPKGMLQLEINEPISSTMFRDSFGSLGLDEEIEKNIINYYKEHHESTH